MISPQRPIFWRWLRWLSTAALLAGASAQADELPEYRLKAAFLFNFMAYTEWPADTGPTLNLCLHGGDPFGRDIDPLHGKVAAGRSIAVHRKAPGESLRNCHAVFVTASALDAGSRALDALRSQPVLTVADSPGALRRGMLLNMNVTQDKVTFEANLQAARSAGLTLSSKLLRLATEVLQ